MSESESDKSLGNANRNAACFGKEEASLMRRGEVERVTKEASLESELLRSPDFLCELISFHISFDRPELTPECAAKPAPLGLHSWSFSGAAASDESRLRLRPLGSTELNSINLSRVVV